MRILSILNITRAQLLNLLSLCPRISFFILQCALDTYYMPGIHLGSRNTDGPKLTKNFVLMELKFQNSCYYHKMN